MTNREPDVIERMLMAFLDQYAKDQSNMDAPMLAAVRVLERCAAYEGHGVASEWIGSRIEHHERRSEGKGY